MYAQCGGTDAGVSSQWSGPYCCGNKEPSECVQLSDTYSQCKPWYVLCKSSSRGVVTHAPHSNGFWEQCGGVIPGTSVPWNGHGRATCCPQNAYCKCVHPRCWRIACDAAAHRYIKPNFYQCVPSGW